MCTLCACGTRNWVKMSKRTTPYARVDNYVHLVRNGTTNNKNVEKKNKWKWPLSLNEWKAHSHAIQDIPIRILGKLMRPGRRIVINANSIHLMAYLDFTSVKRGDGAIFRCCVDTMRLVVWHASTPSHRYTEPETESDRNAVHFEFPFGKWN